MVRQCAAWLIAGLVVACSGGSGEPSAPPPAAGVLPSIVTAPVSVTVAVGQTARFSVAATGSAPLAYQWLRDGADLAGATAAEYTTAAAVAGDTGARFAVRVSNAAGSKVSPEAVLTVNPSAARSEWLAGAARLSGTVREATVQFFDFPKTVRVGDLLAVDSALPSAPRTIELTGEWVPHAPIFGAQVDSTSAVSTGVRERFRTYFKNGRLYRLDLSPAPGAAPAQSLLSAFNTTEACEGDTQAFQDWTAPERAWLLFPAPATGVSNCFSARNYLGVRLDMAPTAAPVRVTARPLDVVRDARGAIEGFVAQDGQRVLLLDASLQPVRTLLDYSAEGAVTVTARRVLGRGDGRYLLFEESRPLEQPNERRIRALRLLPGSTAVTLSSGRGTTGSFVVAHDASGTYFVAFDASAAQDLLHVAPDLTVRVLARPGRLGDGRLYLTPTRVVLITATAAASVPRAGGAVTTLASLGSGSTVPSAVVAGEDIYVQQGIGIGQGGLTIVRSDGTQLEQLARGLIAAALPPAQLDPATATESFDLTERRAIYGSEGASAVLVIDGNFNSSLSNAAVLRYGPDRARSVIGTLPRLQLLNYPAQVPELSDIAVRPGPRPGFDGRYVSAYQAGAFGLLQRDGGDMFLIDTSGGLFSVTQAEFGR